jgi:DNA polymerase elongation subunit (family B)
MEYNVRDVEAVVEIERSKNVLEMYDHIRGIAGATYSDIADSNIGIIDILYLREAKKRGIALPTSVRPDVQHYWGAYVFPPEAGKHKNVVYPDLSSLYSNLFKDMNASPETIIGFEDDLEASEYSEADCHEVYVDTRSEGAKRSADEPERTSLYVLKPEVKESFVRDVIGDLIDMKYEYKKDEYADEAYAAVKRITNSVYGCMGDSVSYGVGFRLFDWRIAEAITLAGRDVIKHTADKFEMQMQRQGYDNSSIIAGDTDSCVCEVSSADGTWENSTLSTDQVQSHLEEANVDSVETPMAETVISSIHAAEYVDSTYPDFMNNRFGIEDGNMAVEIESYSESALFMNKKKRYAQWVRWDEGDLVDEVEVKGFELVRSDSAAITENVQKEVLTKILQEDDPKQSVKSNLKENWDSVVAGNVSLSDIGKPSAINNKLWDYGWSKSTVESGDQIDDTDGNRLEQGDEYINFFTPQPHIRGARYANKYIENEDLSEGSKPMMFYCDGVSVASGMSEIYDYEEQSLNAPTDLPYKKPREVMELDREVDSIAVDDVRNLPDGMLIDWEKMAEKTLRDPIEPIVTVLGWDFDDLITSGEQSGLASFM